jgi:deoxyribodipyrimidine photo-lyase
VDEHTAARAARDKMYGLRKILEARTEADEIQERHGSRLSGLPPSGRRVESGARPSRIKSLAGHPHQPSLFD